MIDLKVEAENGAAFMIETVMISTLTYLYKKLNEGKTLEETVRDYELAFTAVTTSLHK